MATCGLASLLKRPVCGPTAATAPGKQKAPISQLSNFHTIDKKTVGARVRAGARRRPAHTSHSCVTHSQSVHILDVQSVALAAAREESAVSQCQVSRRDTRHGSLHTL